MSPTLHLTISARSWAGKILELLNLEEVGRRAGLFFCPESDKKYYICVIIRLQLGLRADRKRNIPCKALLDSALFMEFVILVARIRTTTHFVSYIPG